MHACASPAHRYISAYARFSVRARIVMAMDPRTAIDPRTRALLEAPIGSTLLRLALPNVIVMVVQSAIGLIETYFVAKLGTDSLAGISLVFPVLMLVQMVSAGAMGGGILSAIARALGSGKRDGSQRPRLACRRDCADARYRDDRLGAGRRPISLSLDGRQRRLARRGNDLFQYRLCRRDPALALQLSRRDHSRRRQYDLAGERHRHRRGDACCRCRRR